MSRAWHLLTPIRTVCHVINQAAAERAVVAERCSTPLWPLLKHDQHLPPTTFLRSTLTSGTAHMLQRVIGPLC